MGIEYDLELVDGVADLVGEQEALGTVHDHGQDRPVALREPERGDREPRDLQRLRVERVHEDEPAAEHGRVEPEVPSGRVVQEPEVAAGRLAVRIAVEESRVAVPEEKLLGLGVLEAADPRVSVRTGTGERGVKELQGGHLDVMLDPVLVEGPTLETEDVDVLGGRDVEVVVGVDVDGARAQDVLLQELRVFGEVEEVGRLRVHKGSRGILVHAFFSFFEKLIKRRNA